MPFLAPPRANRLTKLRCQEKRGLPFFLGLNFAVGFLTKDYINLKTSRQQLTTHRVFRLATQAHLLLLPHPLPPLLCYDGYCTSTSAQFRNRWSSSTYLLLSFSAALLALLLCSASALLCFCSTSACSTSALLLLCFCSTSALLLPHR